MSTASQFVSPLDRALRIAHNSPCSGIECLAPLEKQFAMPTDLGVQVFVQVDELGELHGAVIAGKDLLF